LDKQKLKRDLLKMMLSPMLGWRPLEQVRPGFSIVLGVPWALRHLLPVNLRFVGQTDTRDLHRLHVVFDRPPQANGEEFVAGIHKEFPQLPLTFRFHPPLAGKLVEMINQSKFYASMNWTLGIAQCETRYAVMHDFDLYPLVPNYFTSMIEALRERNLRFTGLELTHFDGLDDSQKLIGTWALGIDVEWLRQNHRPIDCFHTVASINGRRFDLDAFTYIESSTPERDLVGTVTEKDMAHVRNLCSTYLRFTKGELFDVVWRLHLMWYLESLCGPAGKLQALTALMNSADSPRLCVNNLTADFSRTHVTCANVLRDELLPMEKFIAGELREEVIQYIDSFENFLWRYGQKNTILNPDGTIRWSPNTHATAD
jgi:hypothetical protein